MKNILSYLFGGMLILSAVAHIVSPDMYAEMIPQGIPKDLANIVAAISEAGIGILLILPQYRKWGGLAFALLMIAFLPIHIWDMLKENPMIGPSPAGEVRIVIQLLFIYSGWWIYKKTN